MQRFCLLLKLNLFVTGILLGSKGSFCQESNCPLPSLPDSAVCTPPPVKGQFYTKNIVTDFGADPSGRTNSQIAFECAAWFFNVNGGQGKLIIPYGNYLVGQQEFKEPTKITCPYRSEYGWIGRDLMHLTDCSNVQITGILSKGKKPVIHYKDSLRLGGFKKDGSASNYKNNPDGKRFLLPPNCEESEKNDTYYAFAGSTFYFDNCTNVSISGIEIDGNSGQSVLGAFVGSGPFPYEVWGHGVVIWNTKNATIKNMNMHDIGVDGLYINNFTDNGINTDNYNTVVDKLKITNSGRNNISWVGGNGLTITNSTLSRASTGIIKTNPGASLDIEPQTHNKMIDRCHVLVDSGKRIIINDYCMNGYFYNVSISEDREFGLLNADRSGHAKKNKAAKLTISNSKANAFCSIKENSIDFYKCKISGKWFINEVSMPPVNKDGKIRRSTFKLK